jgi:hypothetical protein
LPEADALALLEAAIERLWSSEGSDFLTYLIDRRYLSPETVKGARLGWVSTVAIPKADGNGTFAARGWLIPWFSGGRLVLLKLRRPQGHHPKYLECYGRPDRVRCYPSLEGVRPGRPLIVVEGELDCLLVQQELGESAAVVTFGSASARPAPSARGRLLAASPWYIATDADEPGETSARRWPPSARRVRPPGPFKDWTEVRQAGIDLGRWWSDRLGGIENPDLFMWTELSTWRWGDAAGGSEAGIDNPGHRPSPATLEAATAGEPELAGESDHGLWWGDAEAIASGELGAMLNAAVPPGSGPERPPRPSAPPRYGLTQSGRLIELPRAPGDGVADPLRWVTAAGWNEWHPATPDDQKAAPPLRPSPKKARREDGEPRLFELPERETRDHHETAT